MNLIQRVVKTLRSWAEQSDPVPQEPPVPGRPGGAVGNSRRTESSGGESLSNHSGGAN